MTARHSRHRLLAAVLALALCFPSVSAGTPVSATVSAMPTHSSGAGPGTAASTVQDGTLDAAFGNDGTVATDFGGGTEVVNVVVVLSDERIVAAGFAAPSGGNSDFALVRYLPDGRRDPSFGTDGKVTTDFGGGDDVVHALAVQPDGKVVAAGYATISGARRFALARYQSDGALDATFGSSGRVMTAFGGDDWAQALALQPDGKLVAAGFAASGDGYDVALARYTPAGALDPSFGSGGKTTTDFGGGDGANALVLQPDGRIVVAGRAGDGDTVDFALARYTPAGVLDPSFGSGGQVVTDFGSGSDAAQGLALQPDGNLVVVGSAANLATRDMALARYTAAGVLDPSSGSGGKLVVSIGTGAAAAAVALQADGKLLAAGDARLGGASDFALVRLTSAGALDASFGSGGIVTTEIGGGNNTATALVVQPNGKVLVGGFAWNGNDHDFALARYHAATPGALKFSASAFSTPESASGQLTVRRTGGDAGPVSVTVSTMTGGTATPGSDFTPLATTLTWPDGDHAPRTVTLPVLNDLAVEPDETVTVALSSPTGGAVLGRLSAATLTIEDDDLPLGAYGQTVLSDLPAAYWRLHETSGAIAYDWTGNQHHGTYSNGVILGAAGALPLEADPAAAFDGTTGSVRVADTPALSPAAAVSVEAWVKLAAYSGSYPRLLSKVGAYELTLYTLAGHEGRLEWKVSLVSGDVLATTAYADRLLLNQWYHVVATYDGAAMQIYLNGVQKASRPASGALKDSPTAFTISRGDRAVAATLDEVAVYGTALSAARVQAHYAAAVPAVTLASGNHQSAATGAALAAPFVVTVTDSAGTPVAGIPVLWEITDAPPSATGQMLSQAETTTGASGQASVTLTLGNRAGTYAVRATASARSGQLLIGSPVLFTATAQTASPYAQAVLADSPAAYWRLDETSGTAASDLSGNGNTASYLNGATLGAPGALPDESAATAVTLDGVNDLVAAPDSAALSPVAAVTVEAWVYLNAYSGSYPRLVSKPGAYELTVYTLAGHEGRLEWKLALVSGEVLLTTAYADRLLLGQWYHLAATYDGTMLRIFINGVQRASRAASGAIKDSPAAFTVSRGDRPIAARVDEVAVYGAALPAARLQAHAAFGLSAPPPSPYAAAVLSDAPAAYWRLNEASGGRAADQTSNHNDAAYVNGVTLGQPGALTSESDAAVLLDGVNDYLTVPDAVALSPTASVTVEAWVNLTAYAGSYPRLLSKPGAYELTLYTLAGHEGRLEWKLTLTTGDVLVATAYADRLLLGQWYYLAATYDGTMLRIFINGVQKASKAAVGTLKDSPAAFTMSRPDRALAAKLDEVAVYGTALPAARVQAHYNAR